MSFKFLFILVLFVSLFSSVFAYDEIQDQKIIDCIGNVQEVINSFERSGFNTVRLVDLKLIIEGSYESNLSYESIMKKCDDVDRINAMAFSSRDYIDALQQFYSESYSDDVNMSSVDAMINQIELEFENERYEKINDLVDDAYDEIIEIQSSNSALTVFYESTTSSIASFFEYYWREVLIFLFLSFLFYFTFRKKIKILVYRRKILSLESRKEVIKNLIAKTQSEYFGKGKISEGMYFVRVKKFSDIVRDLDKEILGLNEELLRLGVKKK